MKLVRREVRSGSISAKSRTRTAPTPATSPSWRSGSPAATSIAASVKQMTSAVPRSGWARISSTQAPPTPSTGPATPRRLRAIFGRAARTAAMCSTSASFITSDGWNVSAPAPSQRRAPLTSTPMPGISTSTSITHAASRIRRVQRRAATRPWRESRCMTTSPTAP